MQQELLNAANSLWDMFGYAQGFEYPLGAIFLIGLFLLSYTYVRYLVEWKGYRKIRNMTADKNSLQAIAEKLKTLKKGHPYREAARNMSREKERGGTSESISAYGSKFIEFNHDAYKEIDRYITAFVYIALSLGLLGTLLGIFVLFMSGERNASSDLMGLGIAVVSTMLALVVRLILWPLNIILQAWVRKRFKELGSWATHFAFELGKTEDVVR